MLLVIAIHNNFVIFKIDIGSAFMRTPISFDVKHRWVKLDKKLVELLLELQYEKYMDFVLPDGTVIVEMDKLSYGYVEAAHYWYESLTETFVSSGYKVSNKEKCIFIKCQGQIVAFCVVCNMYHEWLENQVEMLKRKI